MALTHSMVYGGKLERNIFNAQDDNEPDVVAAKDVIQNTFGDSIAGLMHVDFADPIPEMGRTERVLSAYYPGAPSWYTTNASIVNHHAVKYYLDSGIKKYKILWNGADVNPLVDLPLMVEDPTPVWVGQDFDESLNAVDTWHAYFKGFNRIKLKRYMANLSEPFSKTLVHPCDRYPVKKVDLLGFIFVKSTLEPMYVKLYVEPERRMVWDGVDLNEQVLVEASDVNRYLEDADKSRFVEMIRDKRNNVIGVRDFNPKTKKERVRRNLLR